MHDELLQFLAGVARVLEIVGAGAMVLGFVVSSIRCVTHSFRDCTTPAVKSFRRALGRTILIGLEILVAATIVKTITLEPTLEGIGFLAIMVAIRTALGWATVLETYGHWPWQKPRRNTAEEISS